MAASSRDLTIALIVVGIVFFYRLNALAVSMTRYSNPTQTRIDVNLRLGTAADLSLPTRIKTRTAKS